MSKADQLAELWSKADYIRGVYGLRDELLDSLEPYYFIDHPTKGRQEREKIELVKLPDGPSAIDLVQDLFAHAGYTLDVPSGSERPTDRTNAEIAEKYLHTVLKRSERGQRMFLFGQAGWTTAMRGCTAGRVRVVMDWMDEVEDGETGEAGWASSGRIPVLVQLRDPRHVYPSFGDDGLMYVVEHQTRTVEDIQHSYGDKVLAGRSPEDVVTWTEYWDKEVFAYWADSAPVTKGVMRASPPWPHRYGTIPYSFEFARQTSKKEPEKRIRPMLESMRSLLDRQDLLASQQATFISEYIGTSWKLFSNSIDPEQVDLGTGSIIPLDPQKNEDLVALQTGRLPPELNDMQAMLNKRWEQGTFPSTLYGQDVGSSAAGYMVSLLNMSGQARMNSMVQAVERLIADLCETVLEVSHNTVSVYLDGPIPFYWVSDAEGESGETYRARDELKLDTGGLKGQYDVEVSLGEMLPADEQASASLASQYRQPGATGKPLMSDSTLLSKFNLVKNPSDEQMRIERELAMSSPEIQELMRQVLVASVREEMLDKLRKLGIDVDEAMAELQAKTATAPMEQMPQPPQGMDPAMVGQPGMGQPGMDMQQPQIDPMTGLPIDPATGLPIDPATGQPIPPEVLEQIMMEMQMQQQGGGGGMPGPGMEQPTSPADEMGIMPPGGIPEPEEEML